MKSGVMNAEGGVMTSVVGPALVAGPLRENQGAPASPFGGLRAPSLSWGGGPTLNCIVATITGPAARFHSRSHGVRPVRKFLPPQSAFLIRHFFCQSPLAFTHWRGSAGRDGPTGLSANVPAARPAIAPSLILPRLGVDLLRAVALTHLSAIHPLHSAIS